MADGTGIEWTDATWNPITGCSVKSPGCKRCYAMLLAGTRLRSHPSRAGLTEMTNAGPVWTGEVRFNEQWLDQPLRWGKPRMIFVCAHGDLFHDEVPTEWIDKVFAVMALASHHIFQVLTKRADRMRDYFEDARWKNRVLFWADRLKPSSLWNGNLHQAEYSLGDFGCLPNVWLGVSVEDQLRADERIPDLLATPAAVRWLSMEPLLGSINLLKSGAFRLANNVIGAMTNTDWHHTGVSWIVLGGESGPGARPMHPDWARSVRDECARLGVSFLFKQWGEWLPWEPDQLPCFRSQTGELIDRHALPDFNDADLKGWTDKLLYEGDDICVHQLVGKKNAGRLLDGVQHNGFPAASGESRAQG